MILEKGPQDLQKAFDEALNNELGPSFHKRIIIWSGCGGLFPKEIRGYSVDVVEACVATPYGFSASYCKVYQENVMLSVGCAASFLQDASKDFGVDAAFCDFTNKVVHYVQMNMQFLHIGRTTGLSYGKLVPIDSAICVDIKDLRDLDFTNERTYIYAISSPYFAVFEALDVEFEKSS
ncbi:7035_t:CDS:2, partial [Funneliformis geosporum]